MGVQSSKLEKEVPINEFQEGSVPTTPILTPKTTQAKEMDPRSPSLHIARTPLELFSTAASAENLEFCESELQNRHLTLGIDPRSPTNDFKRTPIVLNNAKSDLPKKIYNKNLEKALLSEIQTSSNFLNNNKTRIAPKLLESSPIRRKSDVHKRRSLVGLLETNLDFKETDLDSVFQQKCEIEQIKKTADFNNCNDVQDDGAMSPIEISNKDDSQIVQETQEIEVIPKEIEEFIDERCNQTKECEIEETNNETYSQIKPEFVNLEESPKLDPVSIKSKTPLQSPPKLSTVVLEKVKPEHTTPFVNLTADVKELDKKLTNLIYEDDDLVVCPRIVQLRENVDRSPLKNCNGNEPRAKSAMKLKVSDKPRRSDYAVSRIPVFKEKRATLKNDVQCENTPPRNMEKKKIRLRRSDWDTKDTTLYL